MKTKHCPCCGSEKPLTEFHKNKRTKDGVACYCKSCCSSRTKAKRATIPPDELRDKYYIRHYGVNYSFVTNLLAQQEYLCAICDKDITDKFHLDHCHDTGRIRGALCPQCNHFLGLAYDSVETLQRAIEYLRAAAEE